MRRLLFFETSLVQLTKKLFFDSPDLLALEMRVGMNETGGDLRELLETRSEFRFAVSSSDGAALQYISVIRAAVLP